MLSDRDRNYDDNNCVIDDCCGDGFLIASRGLYTDQGNLGHRLAWCDCELEKKD